MTAYATREIIKIIVPLEDVDNVRHNGELAEIGGGSSVHGNRKDRMSNLKLDQLIGQLGEWAACHYLHGSSDAYYEMRDKRNANPHEGDGGVDGKSKLGVYDVKGSRCKLDGENIQNLKPSRSRRQGVAQELDIHSRLCRNATTLQRMVGLAGWLGNEPPLRDEPPSTATPSPRTRTPRPKILLHSSRQTRSAPPKANERPQGWGVGLD